MEGVILTLSVLKTFEVEKVPHLPPPYQQEEGELFCLTCFVGCVWQTVSLSAGAGPAGLPDQARPLALP